MYRVTIDQGNDVYMLVMNNVASAILPMHNIYDLKVRNAICGAGACNWVSRMRDCACLRA